MANRSIVVLLLIALFAAACGGGDEEAATSVAESATAPEATVTPRPEPTGVTPSTATERARAEPAPTETSEPPQPEAAAGDSGCGTGMAPGTTTETFTFDDVERTYEQVIPSAYDDATALPVVLNWHGLGSNGFEQVTFSDYATLAETEGFIVIAPTGLPNPGDGRNSWELTPDQDPTRDDLAFANALLDRTLAILCADEARVYTTGLSNGGYFSSVLVCEMSERIAAAASIAALTHADDCEPSRAVPYIAFHGTEDAVVPYAGGGESSLAPGEMVPLFELEILAEFAEFAADANCDAEPVVAELSANVTSFDYTGCDDGATMTFYEIQGAGHTWPGSVISLLVSEGAGLGVTTDEISASQTSWEFFEQHSLDD